MDCLNDMTLQKFKLWSTQSLKVFLSSRKKSVEGTFEELVCRAFCAWEENIDVDKNAEQNEYQLLAEYRKKLMTGNDVIPDPFTLTGWTGEKQAMDLWPSVYITDIAKYLMCDTPQEVVDRILNEYKEGKAFRYFDCEWVKEVFYHDIRKNSDVCLMKAKVTPSQSINNKNYDVWVLVKKKTNNCVGGEIVTGYCTCTAGMLGTCNHIAGLLFRVEHAVKTGMTSLTCTEKRAEWNVPKNKTVIIPGPVDSASWTKSDFLNKRMCSDEEDMRKLFTPLNKQQVEIYSDSNKMKGKLYDSLKDEVQGGLFILTVEKKRPGGNKGRKKEVPSSIISATFKFTENESQTNRTNAIMNCLKLSTEDISEITEQTKHQSSSGIWKEHRKGRITASIFQRVCSRVNTLKKNDTADPSALVSTILGESEGKSTMAMKHGLAMEPFAKKCYRKSMRINHKALKTCNTGLRIHHKLQFIAASCDLLVECSCCGAGLCEIKCPESIKAEAPSEKNIPYIKKVDNNFEIDKCHPYYYQMQGQMGVVGRKYCDLFIYTYHGSVTLRVSFDEKFWDDMCEKISWFWHKYVLKTLTMIKEKSTCAGVETDEINKENCCPPPSSEQHVTPSSLQSDNISTVSEPKLKLPTARRQLLPHKLTSRKKRKTLTKEPLFLCGTCGLDCVDNPQTPTDQSVNCDLCNVWVHFVCAGVDSDISDATWLCSKCTE